MYTITITQYIAGRYELSIKAAKHLLVRHIRRRFSGMTSSLGTSIIMLYLKEDFLGVTEIDDNSLGVVA